MLCHDIHTHKRQPGDKNTAVKRDKIKLQQSFVCKQIHAYNANHKQGHDGCGYAP